jgi:hypothetical protein
MMNMVLLVAAGILTVGNLVFVRVIRVKYRFPQA